MADILYYLSLPGKSWSFKWQYQLPDRMTSKQDFERFKCHMVLIDRRKRENRKVSRRKTDHNTLRSKEIFSPLCGTRMHYALKKFNPPNDWKKPTTKCKRCLALMKKHNLTGYAMKAALKK